MSSRTNLLRTAIAIAFLLPVVAPAEASDFNGEVLIAPPPPNWIGGSPVKTESGIQRTWRRPNAAESAASERVVVLTLPINDDTDARSLAQSWRNGVTGSCVTAETADITERREDIGTTAETSVICKQPDDRTTHARAMILFGEFNTFQVERTWSGDSRNPGNPRDSQRLATAWDVFFDRISVCNTLSDSCDADEAAAVHAHPRFKEMRQLQAAERAIVPIDQALQGANAFGRLTGRAEACGEDVTPLLLRVGRMFDFITANDAESTAAQARFELSREDSKQATANLPPEVCGEVRRQFRAHPSRVQGFARYILALI